MNEEIKKIIHSLNIKSSSELNEKDFPSLIFLALTVWEKQKKDGSTIDRLSLYRGEDTPGFDLCFNSQQLQSDHFSEESLKELFYSCCYLQGIGVEQSDLKSFNFLKKASEHGLDIAQNNLGCYYAYGIGTEKSKEQSFLYFKQAAGKENDQALLNLSKCYEHGFGVKQSYIMNMHYSYLSNLTVPLAKKFIDFALRGCSDEKILEDLDNWLITAKEGNQTVQDRLIRLFSYSEKAFIKLGVAFCTKHLINCLKYADLKGNKEAQFQLGRYSGDLLKAILDIRAEFYLKTGLNKQEIEKLFRQFLLRSHEESFRYFKKAAEHGHPTAQYYLGSYYEKGIGVKKSINNAIHYYQLAANQDELQAIDSLTRILAEKERPHDELVDHYKTKLFKNWKQRSNSKDPFALVKLGQCYENGTGVKKSLQKAFQSYKLAADLHDSLGQIMIGRCYEEGVGIEQSFDKAIYYYKLASDQGEEFAKRSLARLLVQTETYDYKEWAIDYLKKNFHERDYGSFVLVNYFETHKLYEEAFPYVQLLADEGDSDYQFLLGSHYEIGQGTEQSYEKALYYYRLAAEKGNVSALTSLSSLYFEGFGVNQSDEKGLYYASQAAQIDDEYGKSFFAECILKKKIKDKEAWAINHLENISSSDSDFKEYACYTLGEFYEEEQLYEKAIYYFKMVVDMEYGKESTLSLDDYTNACCIVGNFFKKKKQYEIAFNYYKKASKHGCIDGIAWLGRCYEGGMGTEQSYEKAIVLYKQAASNGNPMARNRLKKLFNKRFKVLESSVSVD